jgi:hypothetical protein
MTQLTRTERRAPAGRKRLGALAVLACAACCSLPLLLGAGLLTGVGAAVLERGLLVVAAGLAVATLGLSGRQLRRRPPPAAPATSRTGCGSCNCGC